jgi:VanZ family protein
VIGWIWRWGPALAFMAVIFTASAIPNLGPLPANTSDKVAHFAAYCVLGILVVRALARARWVGYTHRAGLKAWVWTTLYGMSDEVHQMLVPGRTASVGDILADAAGAAMGVALAVAVARVRAVKEREV